MFPGPQKVSLTTGDEISTSNHFYTVEDIIGEGGFGIVCKVKRKDRSFAMKLTKMWDFMPNERLEYAKRFRQEFEYGNSLQSDHVVRSHDFALYQGNPFMIMDLCENGSLRDRFTPTPVASELDRSAIGILKGLASLHEEGIIHRDIKPENILFDREHNPKLVDFGISATVKNRHTRANFLGHAKAVFATCVYSPPEQMDYTRAMKVMGNTNDIYAFGATMYEWITNGNYPFGTSEDFAKDMKAFENRRKNMEWDRNLLVQYSPDPKWVPIIERCLQYHPRDRFQSCREILALISGSEDPKPLNTSVVRYHPDQKWKLQIKNGEEIGRIFNLDRLASSYGSECLRMGWLNPEKPFLNEISLAEEYTRYISQYHATLEYDPENHKWFLRDGQFKRGSEIKEWKTSTNGVLVNSQPIDGKPYPLQEGDIILIGDTSLKVLIT